MGAEPTDNGWMDIGSNLPLGHPSIAPLGHLIIILELPFRHLIIIILFRPLWGCIVQLHCMSCNNAYMSGCQFSSEY